MSCGRWPPLGNPSTSASTPYAVSGRVFLAIAQTSGIGHDSQNRTPPATSSPSIWPAEKLPTGVTSKPCSTSDPTSSLAQLCDKGYASEANREAARARGIAPVIPHKANEKDKSAFFARTLYKARARIEQGVGRLKRFKRVALRCEKTARNFRSIVAFAAGLCLIKCVHTA